MSILVMRDAAAFGGGFGRPHVPRQPQPRQQPDELEPQVPLPGIESDPRRSGKGVVVVVPGLAHGDEPGPGAQHLAVLENAGLGTSEKRGQYVHYRLVEAHLANTLNGYLQKVSPVSAPLKA